MVAEFEIPSADERAGIAWWNALTQRERSAWMEKAGNTGVVADAWEAFKRSGLASDTDRE